MKNQTAPDIEVSSKPSTHLLSAIRAFRGTVGDGLNDDELTGLLRQTGGLPVEGGFAFLSFCAGFATLTVPPQDLAKWYPKHGWIVAEKERIARAVAEKHGLLLGEPPDESSSFLFPTSDPWTMHHHLELRNRWESVVIAHPHYLKIRLFGATAASRYVSDAKIPLPLGADLLQDLSALYQP